MSGLPSRDKQAERATDGLPPRGWAFVVFGALFVAVACCVLIYEREGGPGFAGSFFSLGAARSRELFAHLTLWTAILVFAFTLVPALRAMLRRPWLARAALDVGCALVVIVGFLFLNGEPNPRRPTYTHLHDAYHYLLGAKYFDELGYDGLYACTVALLPPDATPRKIRNLEDDRIVATAQILEAAPECKKRFSPARWDEYRRDLEVFAEPLSWRVVGGFLKDKGYNGTPTHSVIAGWVASSVELDVPTLAALTLLDVAALCLMLALLVVAFGWPLGILFSLFFFLNASDLHVITGNSFLRYLWMATLGISVAMIRLGRHRLAGLSMAVSCALNVFPVLFAAGVALRAVFHWLRTRRIARSHRDFFLAAVAGGLVMLGVGATGARGVRSYEDFARAMATHDVAGRLPTNGVGLKESLIDAGGPRPGGRHGPTEGRGRQLEERWHLYLGISAVILALTAFVVRRLDDTEAAILVGFVLLFVVFGPTGYYFTCGSLMVLLWYRRMRTSWAAFVPLLFLLNAIPMFGFARGYRSFYVYAELISPTLALYMILALIALAVDPLNRLRRRDCGPASGCETGCRPAPPTGSATPRHH